MSIDIDESEIPELDISDVIHLQRQYELHGKERVVRWLTAKVALPTSLELKKLNGEKINEEEYYNFLAEHYLDL